MKKLEVGKDYTCVHDNNFIVIDRTEGILNRGFYGNNFEHDLFCSIPNEWREANRRRSCIQSTYYRTARLGDNEN